MCFSASASFGTAGLLTFLGALSIKKARSHRMQLFASTPLIFAIQQASEGIIWLTWGNSAWHWLMISATYVFIFFAGIFWPLWIPTVLVMVEKEPRRKKLLWIPWLCGCFFSIYAAYYLIAYGASADLGANHVAYTVYPIPMAYELVQFLYIIAVVVPCFISSLRGVWLLGLGIIGTHVAAQMWYAHHFASVWCFFAALISGIVLYIVMKNQDR